MHNENESATKADLQALETRLNERYDMLRSEMQHSHDDLKETLRDSETRLLQAFSSFAETNQKRLTETER